MGVLFALVLTVVGRGVGFVRGILFCRMMTDQQLGQWSMVWSFILLLAPLAVLGLPGCFCRFTEHYRQRGQLGTFVRRIARISSVASLVLASAIIFKPDLFAWLVFRDTSQVTITIWLGLSLVFVAAMNFLTSLMESLRQVRLVTFMRFVLGVVFAIASCGLMLVWEDCTAAATVGYAISCIVASIPAAWFLWKHRDNFSCEGESLPTTTMFQRIAPFAIWLWFCNLFSNLFEVADRAMLIHWSPVEASLAQSFVGQYHSGRVIPLLFISVAAMLGGLLIPYLTAAFEKGQKKKVTTQLNWTVKLISIGFTCGAILVLCFSDFVFDTILQGRYQDGLAVLPLTFVYCIWFSMFIVAQDYLWVVEKGRLTFFATAVGLGINVVLNIYLIPVYGLVGAVTATAIANAVNVVFVNFLNHREGCKCDLGMWICALVPLLLLLPLGGAIIALVALALASISSNLILDDEEKCQLRASIVKALNKVKSILR